MKTQMKSALKAMTALLISLICLSGCTVMLTHSYEPYTAEIKAPFLAKNGDFAVEPFHKTRTIEVIDDTHYRACSGYKWSGVTLAILPIPIPLPLRVPTEKDCANYEVQSPDKISYTRPMSTGKAYCCGFCPSGFGRQGRPKFWGCGEL